KGLENEIKIKQNNQKYVESQIRDINVEIDKLYRSDSLLETNIRELDIVKHDLETLIKQKEELLEERKYIDVAIGLLKDGGIKTKIIKQYLPIINKMINQ